MDSLSELKDCLEKRTPILFLGAGFSINSKNRQNENIVLARELCKLLVEKFFPDDETEDNVKKIVYGYQENCELKKLCEYIRLMGKVTERNEFLVDYFSGCHIENGDKRYSICEYPWKKIFTVNIDDLIENIYCQKNKKLNVWNLNNDITKHFHDFPTLIKLHGCVNNPSEGFVFDEEEYTQFQTNDNILINEFGDSAVKNDLIFLGTEFQEDDLKFILNVFTNKGYDYQNQYFFVTPKINDPLTELKINNSKNLHHIKMNTDDFFGFLNEKIILSDKLYNQLAELGMKDISVMYNNIPIEYESKLYYGAEITYADLKYNWDISEDQRGITDWVRNDDNNKLIALYGKEYVGKTCKAKRLLYSFFAIGYCCYEFSLSSTYRIELFLEYICNRVDKNVAVLFENSAYSYELLIKNIIESSKFKHRIVIITTDTISNHNRKRYSLLNNANCNIIQVKENINSARADLIYDKLYEKRSLSRLLDISSCKKQIVDFMIKNNDIIDVLYFSSLGRGFEEHLKQIITSSMLNNKFIVLLIFYNDLGITQIPVFYFCRGATALNKNFNYERFKNQSKKILQIENGNLHLRYLRYINNYYSSQLGYVEKMRVIRTLIQSISGRFNEGEYNEISELFYKAINLKSLKRHLNKSKIKELYASLEKMCEQYSYYWVQRGICAQKQNEPEFEDADRFLRLAREIHPGSYQVNHALAKNMIERGLYEIKNESKDINNYFDSGIQNMQNLMYDQKFNRAYDYSLHAYISSWLRYCEYTNTTLSHDICMIINESVGKLHTRIVDKNLFELFLQLKKYARKNYLSNYLNAVVNTYWKPNDYNIDYDEGYEDINWSLL